MTTFYWLDAVYGWICLRDLDEILICEAREVEAFKAAWLAGEEV